MTISLILRYAIELLLSSTTIDIPLPWLKILKQPY